MDTPPAARRPRALAAAISAGIAALVFGGAGFWWISATGRDHGLGETLFLLLPFAVGFAASMAAWPRFTVIAGAVAALGCGLAGLWIAGLEGWICIVMALPLILPGIVIGATVGLLLRRRFTHTMVSVLGLLAAVAGVVAAHGREQASPRPVRDERVVTSTVVAAAPGKVWSNLGSFDALRGPQPMLLRMGLPVPTHCTLEGSGVGATRTCYFDKGWVRERVTVWEPPRRMEMRVVEAELPGRPWLGFSAAGYEIRPAGSGAEVTRWTRLTSVLRPGWYWRVMERAAVDAEHRFILQELERRVRAP